MHVSGLTKYLRIGTGLFGNSFRCLFRCCRKLACTPACNCYMYSVLFLIVLILIGIIKYYRWRLGIGIPPIAGV